MTGKCHFEKRGRWNRSVRNTSRLLQVYRHVGISHEKRLSIYLVCLFSQHTQTRFRRDGERIAKSSLPIPIAIPRRFIKQNCCCQDKNWAAKRKEKRRSITISKPFPSILLSPAFPWTIAFFLFHVFFVEQKKNQKALGPMAPTTTRNDKKKDCKTMPRCARYLVAFYTHCARMYSSRMLNQEGKWNKRNQNKKDYDRNNDVI